MINDNKSGPLLPPPMKEVTFLGESVCYLCRRLASGEGIVTIAVTLCVCPPCPLYHVSTARHISLSGGGNELYPVLSRCFVCLFVHAVTQKNSELISVKFFGGVGIA